MDFVFSWNTFMKSTEDEKLLLQFLKNETELRNAKSVLSIGPGGGRVDVDFLSSLPNLERYIGVEPEKELRETLQKCLKELSQKVKVSIEAGTMKTYKGPDEAVDLILMVHVCYYYADSLRTEIKRALQWLRPGGKLVLINSDHCDVIKELETCIYGFPLTSMDFKRQLTQMKIPFTEERIPSTFRWSPETVAPIVHLYMRKYPNAEQEEECCKIMEKYSKDGNKILGVQLALVIPQTALNSIA